MNNSRWHVTQTGVFRLCAFHDDVLVVRGRIFVLQFGHTITLLLSCHQNPNPGMNRSECSPWLVMISPYCA